METIPKSACQKIGFIRKTHGVFGELILEFDMEFEESVAETNRFFIELDGLLVPFFIRDDIFRFKSAKTAIVGFDGVVDEKYAHRLVGNPVYLYMDEIIDEPVKNPISQFLNFKILDEHAIEVGLVKGVDDYKGNIVLTVVSNKKEFLIPFNPDLVISVDEKQKTLTLRIPEGLLD